MECTFCHSPTVVPTSGAYACAACGARFSSKKKWTVLAKPDQSHVLQTLNSLCDILGSLEKKHPTMLRLALAASTIRKEKVFDDQVALLLVMGLADERTELEVITEFSLSDYADALANLPGDIDNSMVLDAFCLGPEVFSSFVVDLAKQKRAMYSGDFDQADFYTEALQHSVDLWPKQIPDAASRLKKGYESLNNGRLPW